MDDASSDERNAMTPTTSLAVPGHSIACLWTAIQVRFTCGHLSKSEIVPQI
jgi:hypothetical protein